MNYKIKSRIWIEVDDQVLLGHGRVELLKAINNCGSLSKGARSLDMSYKKAWDLVDAMNKAAKQPLVETAIGGKNGGGATVTPYGTALVNAFDDINKKCWKFLDNQTKNIKDL
ncbi:winged helix-turn-helix domain-containing protein [Zhouia amylolytica]|uniref:winged helix-turn-helix domain-containing protein n=1 Tax=Zhouia amylolytica TaxID=376730 RepID=UPI0020CF7662|nr:winged helix-turn-helix domain-containing protein [Zhouia amylolytica]MCQ0111281.1 winged helix-turn-helix domain-containing protein [Zhouia amylolytica]